MAQLERTERLQIMLSEAEWAAVENWRFESRMPSRAAAVRELLRRGLAANGFYSGTAGLRHSRQEGTLSDASEDASVACPNNSSDKLRPVGGPQPHPRPAGRLSC